MVKSCYMNHVKSRWIPVHLHSIPIGVALWIFIGHNWRPPSLPPTASKQYLYQLSSGSGERVETIGKKGLQRGPCMVCLNRLYPWNHWLLHHQFSNQHCHTLRQYGVIVAYFIYRLVGRTCGTDSTSGNSLFGTWHRLAQLLPLGSPQRGHWTSTHFPVYSGFSFKNLAGLMKVWQTTRRWSPNLAYFSTQILFDNIAIMTVWQTAAGKCIIYVSSLGTQESLVWRF